MMLRYLELFDQADAVEHAVGVTLESGVLPGDVVGYDKGASTTDYTDAIISNLGKRSETWTVRDHTPLKLPEARSRPRLRAARDARGRRPGRVRRVAAVGERARGVAHGAHRRHEALAQDDLARAARRSSRRRARSRTRSTTGARGSSSRRTRGTCPTRMCTSCWSASRAATAGCTSRSSRSSTASSASPAIKERTRSDRCSSDSRGSRRRRDHRAAGAWRGGRPGPSGRRPGARRTRSICRNDLQRSSARDARG